MRFQYYPDNDSLYIDLSNGVTVRSNQVAPGVTLDFDQEGRLVGIDVDKASSCVDLFRLETVALPIVSLSMLREGEENPEESSGEGLLPGEDSAKDNMDNKDNNEDPCCSVAVSE